MNKKNETKEISTIKGRKPTLFCLKHDALYTIGIEVTNNSIHLALFNFIQDKIDTIVHDFDVNTIIADELASLMAEKSKELLKRNNIPMNKLVGLGIAGPGIIDTKNGIVLRNEYHNKMKDYNLVEKINEFINCQITLSNNTTAQAYYHYTNNKQYGKTLFTVVLRHDINGAYIEDRKVFRDSKGYTVDVGHLIISPDGPLCKCGERGCLESFIYNIEGKHDNEILMNLDQLLTRDLTRLDYITSKIVDYLAVICKNAVRLFNPESILILTKNEEIAKILKSKILKKFEQKVSRYQDDTPKNIYTGIYVIEYSQRAMSEQLLINHFSRIVKDFE